MKSPNAPMTLEEQLREMNEALRVSSIRQYELTEQAQKTEAALREAHAKLQEHADELDRFNRVAIERELRMIELKKEVDESCKRHGEAARYTLEFDQQSGIKDPGLAEQPPPTMLPNDIVPLESVLCTEEFARRPSRQPDYRAEILALMALAQALAHSPGTILQTLPEKIMEVVKADSAGISLLTKDDKRFYWPAIAGMWKPHIGGGTPRDFSPCGDVLDRNAPLFLKHIERRYNYFLPVTPPVEECLLVPFYVEGKTVGTIWAIAHDNRLKFDAEDLRKLESLGWFASSAYQVTEQRHKDQDSRRAALNLMGEAVQARQTTEKLNEKLRESHDRFEALLEASPLGMYLVDAELRIRLVSRKARPMFGEIGELIGRDLVEVIHILWPPECADEIVSRFRRTIATGEPHVSIEFSELRYDRKVRESYDWQIHRITLADGKYGVVCYFIDVSERMRLSNDLRQNAADMSNADRRKNEFLALLAHELRNPLAPIRNALQIIRLSDGNHTDVQLASDIMERHVSQMVRLIDDLLDVSRISRGKIELRVRRVELASVVRQAVEASRPAMELAEQTLTITLPRHPIHLNADPTRLAQVVGNLLNNANKYTDKGGHISLTVEREGDQAVICVRDNGVGIAASELLRIFEMFAQVDTSLERSAGGLGIGLTLVKNLVEMHDGMVSVHSAGVGQGSEFAVCLPVIETPETAQPVPPEPTVSATTNITGQRVLVVDDNRLSANSLTTLFQMTGNETHTAYDGLEAVEVAAKFRPGVILLDIGLPKLNGYEAARKIREQPFGKKIVIVALTGWGQDEDRQKSKEAGINGHLVKPVKLDDLMKLLAELQPGR